MTDFNQKTHDTDVGSHGGQSRQMTEVFENQEFGSIRVLQEAGKTFFCASDVAKALEYGKSSQLRFLHGRPVAPIGYVQGRNAQHKRKSVNKYTSEGLELIHKNLNIDTKTMLWLMRNPVQDRPIEYADNRISLYRVT